MLLTLCTGLVSSLSRCLFVGVIVAALDAVAVTGAGVLLCFCRCLVCGSETLMVLAMLCVC